MRSDRGLSGSKEPGSPVRREALTKAKNLGTQGEEGDESLRTVQGSNSVQAHSKMLRRGKGLGKSGFSSSYGADQGGLGGQRSLGWGDKGREPWLRLQEERAWLQRAPTSACGSACDAYLSKVRACN